MSNNIEMIQNEAIESINKSSSVADVEKLRIKYLGKKGVVTDLLKSLSELPIEEKPVMGKKVNVLKQYLLTLINSKKEDLSNKELEDSLSKESVDITQDGRRPSFGKNHPISSMVNEMLNIFNKMGFTYVDSFEIEKEYYNFDALNIPSTHPARDDQDSFYIDDEHLLRTQTSTTQIRIMEKFKPPLAVVHPGRCYRRDTVDATHMHTFHQIEGLLVDKNVSFANLKATVKMFVQELIGKDTQIRLRPSYFPFTEPSAELDATFTRADGRKGWIELGGLGMVDPQVLKNVGIDPEVYSGWAFGMGIERFAMTKYGITDIRMFYENDVRFINQL